MVYICYHSLTELSYRKSATLISTWVSNCVNSTAWLLDYCPAWLLYLPHIAGVPCGLPNTAAAMIVCMAAVPTPHSYCTLLHAAILVCMAAYLPHITVVHVWVSIAASVRN